MQGHELKEALVARFGPRGWQAKAAAFLGRDVSSVRRWASGQVPVPGPVTAALKADDHNI